MVIRSFFCGMFLALVLSRTAHAQNSIPSAVIDGTSRQEIKGWGLYPAYAWPRDTGTADGQQNISADPQRAPLREALYNELRPTIIRVEIPWTGCNNDSGYTLKTANFDSLVAHLRKARDHGVTQYITTVWSPPAFMKGPTVLDQPASELYRSRVTVGGVQTNTYLLASRQDKYAGFIARALKYLTQQAPGMTLVAHIAQNEPNYARDYPNNFAGCSFRDPGTGLPSDATTFNSLLKSLRSNLNAQGLDSVSLLGPDGEGYKANLVPAFFGDKFYKVDSDPSLSAAVGGFASHSYATGSALSSARGYGAAATWISNGQYPSAFLNPAQARNKDLFMTEYGLNEPDAQNGNRYSSVNSIEGVLKTARHLAGDISLVPNTYWFWWRGWSNKPAGSTSYEDLLLGEFGTTKPNTVARTRVFYFLKTLWNAAPGGQGWRVRDITSSDTLLLGSRNTLNSHEIDMCALADGGGSHMVVVISNWQFNAQYLRLSGLAGKSAQIYTSTATQDMAFQGDLSYYGNTTNLNLPARSVNVIVTR